MELMEKCPYLEEIDFFEGQIVLGCSRLCGPVWTGCLAISQNYNHLISKDVTFTETRDTVSSCRWFSNDRILSAEDSGFIRIWAADFQTGLSGPVYSICAHGDLITSLSLSSGPSPLIFSTSYDKAISAWQLYEPGEAWTFSGATRWTNGAVCDSDKNLFVALSMNGTASLFDIRDAGAKCNLDIKTLQPGAMYGTAVSWKPATQHIAIGSATGYVLSVDLRELSKVVYCAKSHNAEVTSLAFHPNRPNQIASGSEDGCVIVSDLDSSSQIYKDTRHKDFVRCVKYDQSSVPARLCSCSWDNSVHSHEIAKDSSVDMKQ